LIWTLSIAFLMCLSRSGYSQMPAGTVASIPNLNNRIYVDGVQYPYTQAGVQRALDDACAGTLGGAQPGTTVYLPPMSVPLSSGSGQQLLITCPVALIGAGPSQTSLVVTDSASDKIPVIRIAQAQSRPGWFEIEGIRITSTSHHGGDGLLLENSNTAASHLLLHKTEISHLAASSWAVHVSAASAGSGVYGEIYGNELTNGIFIERSGPGSWSIDENEFRSDPDVLTPCIEVQGLVPASRITVFNNGGGCVGGFFVGDAVTQCRILYNDVRQPFASSEPNSAVIDLAGESRVSDGCEVRGNKIDEGHFAKVGIRLTKATHTTIEGNQISLSPEGGVGILVGPGAYNSVIPYNEFMGTGGGSVPIRNADFLPAFATRGPDGSAKSPTFSFANHPRTGWYSDSGGLQSTVDAMNSLAVLKNGIQIGDGQIVGWSPTIDPSRVNANAGLSSCGPGCVAVGDGSPGSASGEIRSASAVFSTAAFGRAMVSGDLVVGGRIFTSTDRSADSAVFVPRGGAASSTGGATASDLGVVTAKSLNGIINSAREPGTNARERLNAAIGACGRHPCIIEVPQSESDGCASVAIPNNVTILDYRGTTLSAACGVNTINIGFTQSASTGSYGRFSWQMNNPDRSEELVTHVATFTGLMPSGTQSLEGPTFTGQTYGTIATLGKTNVLGSESVAQVNSRSGTLYQIIGHQGACVTVAGSTTNAVTCIGLRGLGLQKHGTGAVTNNYALEGIQTKGGVHNYALHVGGSILQDNATSYDVIDHRGSIQHFIATDRHDDVSIKDLGGNRLDITTKSGLRYLSFSSPNVTVDPDHNGFRLVAGGGLKVGFSGSTINTVVIGSARLRYPTVPAHTSQEQLMTVSGARTDNFGVFCSPRSTLENPDISWSAWVSTANTVSIRITNPTAKNAKIAAADWGCSVVQ